MLIISKVCAEFHNRAGEVVFAVHPYEVKSLLTAPEAIREDPLFDMLLQDGSIKAVRSEEQKKRLEKDPDAGPDAEGRKGKTGGKGSEPGTGEAGLEPEPAPAAEADADTPASPVPAKTSRKAAK